MKFRDPPASEESKSFDLGQPNMRKTQPVAPYWWMPSLNQSVPALPSLEAVDAWIKKRTQHQFFKAE